MKKEVPTGVVLRRFTVVENSKQVHGMVTPQATSRKSQISCHHVEYTGTKSTANQPRRKKNYHVD